MNDFTLTRKIATGLLGLCLCSIGITSALAEDCVITDAASLDSCKKDQPATVSGPRVDMFDVPEYYMMADPSFSGGEGMQDYMASEDGTQIILHTNDEVQCPGDLKVIGALRQEDLGEGMAWILSVTGLDCL